MKNIILSRRSLRSCQSASNLLNRWISSSSSSASSSADGITQPAQRGMPVDSKTKVKNVVVAAALLSFVGLVYYTAISKMSKTVS